MLVFKIPVLRTVHKIVIVSDKILNTDRKELSQQTAIYGMT